MVQQTLHWMRRTRSIWRASPRPQPCGTRWRSSSRRHAPPRTTTTSSTSMKSPTPLPTPMPTPMEMRRWGRPRRASSLRCDARRARPQTGQREFADVEDPRSKVATAAQARINAVRLVCHRVRVCLRRRRRCNRRRRRRRRLRLRLCLRRRRAAHRAVTVDASAAAVTSGGRTAGVAIAPHGGGTGPAAPVVSRHRRVGPLLTATPDGRARPIVGALPPSGRPCLHVARTGGTPRGAACGGGGVGGAARVGAPEAARDAEPRCQRSGRRGAPRAPRGARQRRVVASPLELLASAPSEWGEDAVPNPRAVPDLRATSSGEGGTERDGRGTPTKQAQPSRGHGRPPHPQWRPLVPLLTTPPWSRWRIPDSHPAHRRR